MRYRLRHAPRLRHWPRSREYELQDILDRAKRDGRVVKDAHGRSQLRNARKLYAISSNGKSVALEFAAVPEDTNQ